MKVVETYSGVKQEASAILVRRLYGIWGQGDQEALEARLAGDAAFTGAWRLAQEALAGLDAYGKSEAGMRDRERALAYGRVGKARRRAGLGGRPWAWAAGFAAVVVLAITWQLSPWGYRAGLYRTGVGEQRIVDLDDHSRVALDARTQVVIHYTPESRTIEMLGGQAQFYVASDPARPFKVKAGDRTIVALGTVFTVDFSDRKLQVAMVEGRVAIVGEKEQVAETPSVVRPAKMAKAIELSGGDEADFARDGTATVTHQADIGAATAWRDGRVVFKGESLGEAVQRINRYSRVQVVVEDAELAREPINGMFDAGDTQGFVNAVRLALPVEVEQRDSRVVRLSLRR